MESPFPVFWYFYLLIFVEVYSIAYCYRFCPAWFIYIYFLDDGGNFFNHLLFQCLFCNLSNYKLNISSYISSLLPNTFFNQEIFIVTGKLYSLIFHKINWLNDLLYPLYTFHGLTSRNRGENLLSCMKCQLCYHIVYTQTWVSFLIPYMI